MKRILNLREIGLLVILLVLSSAVQAQYKGDTFKQVKASGAGTISFAYVETPGFVYKDQSGHLTGICIDIMKDFVDYVNKTKGVNLTAKYVGDGASFSGMFDKVKASSGGLFGFGNINITDARKKVLKYSPPFITNNAILITQPNVPTLTNLSNIATTFAGLTAYTAKGTLNEKRLLGIKKQYFPAMKIAYVSSSLEAEEKVLQDPKSFSYLDLAFYLDAVAHRKPLKRHPVGDKSSEQFGFIMPMNSDWQPLMEEFFSANGGYTNSVSYKKILTKHLGDTGVKLLEAVQ